MSKAIPTVGKYMSTTPITIGPDTTLAEAKQQMIENNIRHLPVVRGNELLGLVTSSDLRAIESIAGLEPGNAKVSHVMRGMPFTARPTSPLDSVVDEMVAHKWGSAIITDNRQVVGVFTSIDAMRALVELMRTRLQ